MNEGPSFLVTPIPKVANEGDRVKFSCKVRGKPLPQLTWFKEQQIISQAEEVEIIEKQNEDKIEVEGTLNLKNATGLDESELYRIQAENSIGAVSHTFSLAVNKAPEFIKVPAEVEVIEGEPASVTAVATGRPLPDLVWYKDNKALADGEEVSIENVQADGESRGTMDADPVQLSHEGKYKVKATNVAGSVSAAFPISG